MRKADSQLPVKIAPDDGKIQYIGRFDTQDNAGPRCAWSNSSVKLKFVGTALGAKVADSGENQWQVVIDGKPTRVLDTKGAAATLRIVDGLTPGEHTVELVKRTEAFCGNTQFQGFQLSEGVRLLSCRLPNTASKSWGIPFPAAMAMKAKTKPNTFHRPPKTPI